MMTHNYETVTYFSFEEVFKFMTGEEYSPFDTNQVTAFKSAMTNNPYNIKAHLLTYFLDNDFNAVLSNFFSRYCKTAVVRQVNEKELKSKYVLDFLIKLLNVINKKWDYYSKLFKLYRESQNQLMEDVKAITKSKSIYNDTPQLEGVEGFEGDDFATNLTIGEGESSTPLNTKIMRLKEIQDHYKNVMSDFIDELERVTYEIDI